jgi:hypothetical protein
MSYSARTCAFVTGPWELNPANSITMVKTATITLLIRLLALNINFIDQEAFSLQLIHSSIRNLQVGKGGLPPLFNYSTTIFL